jgi:hypothetical protein
MNGTKLSGSVLAVAVLVAVGVAAIGGVGPITGGDAGGTGETDNGTDEEFPTAETTNDSEAGTSGDGEPFTFSVDEVEECGQTCRDVTATLHNEQSESASNVTTYIRIYAGENTTAADDVVWEGTVDVGTLDANASETTTERVDLSFRDALAVDQNDGWITVQTTVESEDATVTFRESRRVA